MAGVVGVRHGISFEMIRGARRLLLEHALNDVNRVLESVISGQSVFHILL
jgi:hypothetical protein